MAKLVGLEKSVHGYAIRCPVSTHDPPIESRSYGRMGPQDSREHRQQWSPWFHEDCKSSMVDTVFFTLRCIYVITAVCRIFASLLWRACESSLTRQLTFFHHDIHLGFWSGPVGSRLANSSLTRQLWLSHDLMKNT